MIKMIISNYINTGKECLFLQYSNTQEPIEQLEWNS